MYVQRGWLCQVRIKVGRTPELLKLTFLNIYYIIIQKKRIRYGNGVIEEFVEIQVATSTGHLSNAGKSTVAGSEGEATAFLISAILSESESLHAIKPTSS